MKKIIVSLLMAVGVIVMQAQTNTAIPDYGNTATLPTPNTITSRFNADYPNNNPMWTSDGSNYRADYNDGATSLGRAVTYDKDGNMISRDEELANSTYPSGISDYYTQNYPAEKNYHVWSSTDKAGNTTYYTNRNSETLWFDKNGKYKSKSKNKYKKAK